MGLDYEKIVKDTLFNVAPDLEGQEVAASEPFRDQFEIDSIDFFNFIIGLSKITGLDIPEADYPELESLERAVAYLERRQPRHGT